MARSILAFFALLVPLLTGATAVAVDYFWTNASGGAFDEPSNWTPFAPPATQGPGGAADTVNFDLGVPESTPYFVTDMGSENSQLIVHDDSLRISIFVHHELSSPGAANPSVIVGAASGDHGVLTLIGGGVSVLDTQLVRIGNVAGSEGSVRIDGLEWNSGNFRVGHGGNGTLSMDSDATLNSGNASIAHQMGSDGRATVAGQWNIGESFVIGRQGQGSLGISSGGNISSNTSVIGDFSDGVGFASVSATWNTVGSLTVGNRGFGSLTIDDDSAHVSSVDAFVGRQAGSVGGVNAQAGMWTINGRLSIGGDAGAATAGGVANVSINGGTVSVAQDVTIFGGGHVELEAGLLDAPIITVQTGGTFNWTGGELFVDTFQGDLSNEGGTLAAREGSNSILVSSDYTQSPDGVLQIAIDGPAASSQYDSMIVGDTASLGGVLLVDLAEDIQPSPSETYTILDAVSIDASSFSNVANGERMFLNFSEGSFIVNYGPGSPFDPSQVVLSDFRRAADANFDLQNGVDGNDLALWKAGFGLSSGADHMDGDADGDGDVDGDDFLVWQQQLGDVPSVPVIAAVPELATFKALCVALAIVGCRTRLTRSSG